MVETLSSVLESNLCETSIEESKVTEVARVAGKNIFAHFKTSLRLPLTPVSKDVEMLFLDHENWLSAIIGTAFVNDF